MLHLSPDSKEWECGKTTRLFASFRSKEFDGPDQLPTITSTRSHHYSWYPKIIFWLFIKLLCWLRLGLDGLYWLCITTWLNRSASINLFNVLQRVPSDTCRPASEICSVKVSTVTWRWRPSNNKAAAATRWQVGLHPAKRNFWAKSVNFDKSGFCVTFCRLSFIILGPKWAVTRQMLIIPWLEGAFRAFYSWSSAAFGPCT